MTKQIIILDVFRGPGADTALNAVFWYPVALARQVPVTGAVSSWRGAIASDNTNLASGAVVEELFSTQYPSAFTGVQIKAALVTEYNARLAAFTARPNPNQFYGLAFDGTVWA